MGPAVNSGCLGGDVIVRLLPQFGQKTSIQIENRAKKQRFHFKVKANLPKTSLLVSPNKGIVEPAQSVICRITILSPAAMIKMSRSGFSLMVQTLPALPCVAWGQLQLEFKDMWTRRKDEIKSFRLEMNFPKDDDGGAMNNAFNLGQVPNPRPQAQGKGEGGDQGLCWGSGGGGQDSAWGSGDQPQNPAIPLAPLAQSDPWGGGMSDGQRQISARPDQNTGWNQPQQDQGWDQPQNTQGWDQQQQDQGWDQPQQNQGWDQPQQNQGWNQPQQDQGWDQQQQDQGWDQPQQDQGWDQVQQNQGWDQPNQGDQPASNQGWDQPQQDQGPGLSSQETGWDAGWDKQPDPAPAQDAWNQNDQGNGWGQDMKDSDPYKADVSDRRDSEGPMMYDITRNDLFYFLISTLVVFVIGMILGKAGL